MAHELVRRGHAVHVLLRDPARAWRLAPVWGGLHVHRADLVNADATRSVVRAVRPRAVLHLATHGAYEKQADARAILQINVVGTYNLLEATADAGAALFVSTGSFAAVAGDSIE